MKIFPKYSKFCHTFKAAYVYIVISFILFTRHEHILSSICIYVCANHCTSN